MVEITFFIMYILTLVMMVSSEPDKFIIFFGVYEYTKSIFIALLQQSATLFLMSFFGEKKDK